MPGCCSPIICPPLIRKLGRRKQFQIVTFASLICSQTCELIGPNSNRRHSPIHILNDDVLLNIFYLYRLEVPHKYNGECGPIFASHNQRWWYRLAHVCRQWRSIILGSPSRLNLHLYCTKGVPVADMLANSPPLPLSIHYSGKITADDESGILLALSCRDRVRHIYLWMSNVGKFVTVMDDQFPILEQIYIHSRTELDLPVTFQAPNLRHLRLWTASLPIGSPLLTTAAGLVTLLLLNIPASAYFPPSYLLTRLSLMLQLEKLVIRFHSPHPNRDVERRPRQILDVITLPSLRWFVFRGTTTYLEGLVARISAPSLSTIRVHLFNQLSFTFPRLLQFMQTSENLRFTAVQVTFGELSVSLNAVPSEWDIMDVPLVLEIMCRHLDWQVASAVQLLRVLSPVLSVVEQVTFSYKKHNKSPEWHNDVDRRHWRELLRSFTNAKAIHVQDDVVDKILRSLPSDDGEPPLELLPNLEKVGYSGDSGALDAFLNERQVAGRPVSLHLVDPSMFEIPLIMLEVWG
jgi:F-box-like